MNGMKAKAARRAYAKRFTEDGIPVNPNEWTADDWRDLHMAIEFVKRRIKERHERPGPNPD